MKLMTLNQHLYLLHHRGLMIVPWLLFYLLLKINYPNLILFIYLPIFILFTIFSILLLSISICHNSACWTSLDFKLAATSFSDSRIVAAVSATAV